MRCVSCVKEFSEDINAKPIKYLISEISIPQKNNVLLYMKSIKPNCAADMILIDGITGESIKSEVLGYEDDIYYWDTRHIYHFEKYNLKLDDEFIRYVLEKQ